MNKNNHNLKHLYNLNIHIGIIKPKQEKEMLDGILIIF
jgi:hypothetical protein